ncbi:Thiol-disulfide isomerase or thioredoxin [Parapedobacter composti]|uniref:Thiol-disulfide isomerase or thioredoxin n=2 Tax=Parapedobacter composti TaxID=623281 RepID=A0A1I1M0I4_9SPHI|nr:Thiol-disulfide isomerase or thioredoxin [Parapedobacter composti]
MKPLVNQIFGTCLLSWAVLIPLVGSAQDQIESKQSRRDSFITHFGQPGHFVLSGKVQNLNEDFFEFGMTTYLGNVTKAVPVKYDGTFNERFEVSNTQDIYLYLPGSRTIILSVVENDTLALNWDQNALLESLSIHSADTARDLQLQVQWAIHQKHRISLIDLRRELNNNESTYTPVEKYERINGLYNAVLETVLAYADGGKADVDRILLAQYYNLTNLLIDHGLYPTYRLKAVLDTTPNYAVFKLDDPFPWYTENYFIHVPDYRDFYEALARKSQPYFGTIDVYGGREQTNFPMAFYNHVRGSQGSTLMQDWLLANQLLTDLNHTDFSFVRDAYNRFIEECTTPFFKSSTEAFQIRTQRISAGNDAPDFTLKDEQGRAVSLADFKGKVVYIDFWGVYCGPCIYDIQHYVPKIHEFYKDKDVVFINICVDVGETEWKAALKKYNLHGINLIAEGWSRHPVCQAYNVQAIPNYKLINRDGTIANNNPERPSRLAAKLGNNEIDKTLAK